MRILFASVASLVWPRYSEVGSGGSGGGGGAAEEANVTAAGESRRLFPNLCLLRLLAELLCVNVAPSAVCLAVLAACQMDPPLGQHGVVEGWGGGVELPPPAAEEAPLQSRKTKSRLTQ